MLVSCRTYCVLLASLLALGGCSSKPATGPVAAPSSADATATESPPPSQSTATPTSIESEGTRVVNPPPVEAPFKPADDGSLRSLVARLARKEGSAWKIDEDVAKRLDELGPDATDQLLPLLEDSSADVRRGAAYHLLRLFDTSRDDMVSAYTRLLADEDRTIRGIALSAFSTTMPRLRPQQKSAIAPELALVLGREGEEEQHRAAAARLLGDIGKEATSLMPQLSAAASDDASPKVRGACLTAISRIGDPTVTVPVFQKGLKDSDASVRAVALTRLRALGRDAAPAVDELAKLLEDREEKTRLGAAEALVRIGSKSVPALEARLESKSPDTRYIAVYALGKMGPLASPALPSLKKRLSDSDPKVKELASGVVAQLESQQ